MFKKLWEFIKAWLKTVVLPWLKGLWQKFVTWFLGKELVWIKKNWKEIVNFFVVLIAFWGLKHNGAGLATFIVRIWLYALILYYVLVKGLGIQNIFHKPTELNPQPEPPVQ